MYAVSVYLDIQTKVPRFGTFEMLPRPLIVVYTRIF